jgi:CDP-diglyceride synthetase
LKLRFLFLLEVLYFYNFFPLHQSILSWRIVGTILILLVTWPYLIVYAHKVLHWNFIFLGWSDQSILFMAWSLYWVHYRVRFKNYVINNSLFIYFYKPGSARSKALAQVN